MEQELELFEPVPQSVRRQLLFMTPMKRKTFMTQKDTEIQNTPKAKTSKPKIQSNAPRQRVQIDFGVEDDYFLNQDGTIEKPRREEDPIFADESQIGVFGLPKSPAAEWYFESPLLTAKKSKASPGRFNDYTAVPKEAKQKRSCEDSPFCKLLNESDKYSIRTYQTLDGISEQDEEEEMLREKYAEEIKTFEKFFNYFEERSANISSLFVPEPVFEIIDEERVYPLNITLNALAKAFLRFECAVDQVDYEYKFGYSPDGNEVILTTSGRLVGEETRSDFVLSVKIIVNERLIDHAKLKIM